MSAQDRSKGPTRTRTPRPGAAPRGRGRATAAAPPVRRVWASVEGEPDPLGVTFIPEEAAYNFALYSRYADAVTLLLYRARDTVRPAFRYTLDPLRNKSDRVWHCRVSAEIVDSCAYYAYRVSGPPPAPPIYWHAFDPDKILLDPHARSVHVPERFSRNAAKRRGSNAGRAPLGVLHVHDNFDWTGDQRPYHEHDLVIYELHVRGFTAHPNSGVPANRRGTFLGLIDKVPYLRELGVTAVELMPVYQFDPQEGNFWGYMPLSLFAPHGGYAHTREPQARHDEFRTLVKALHAAGIEVILDVVFNHTAEADHVGPTYSYRGIDNVTYYLMSQNAAKPYLDFTGCGNTLHLGHRHVRRLVVESLRYWVEQMHVDGFRVDLASAALRGPTGEIDWSDPPIIGQIMADPVLSRVRWIVEPWDAAGAYQLGQAFPAGNYWQWNDRFRDEMRRFVRGEAGLVSSIMTRLYGSDDLFPDRGASVYHAYQSVNFVTSHDGFTLYDLVAYNEKHNLANGRENADGVSHNHSWNCGYEGDEGAPAEVRALRQRQTRNFCCLLLLSNGTPMLRAGDEFLQTQGGNNNPYNQDNETSWLDWDRRRTHQDMFRFFQKMIAFRQAHPSISRARFWRDDVRWFGVGPQADLSPDSRSLAYCLHGASQGDTDLYVMINAGQENLAFEVQEGRPEQWRRIIDTSRPSPDDFCDFDSAPRLAAHTYPVEARSVVVLLREPCR
jgi:glycogen operon protein